MANRFPLILNTSSNQLQELPSGDSLDLTGSGLNLTGGTNIIAGAVAVGVVMLLHAYLRLLKAESTELPKPLESVPVVET